MNIRHFLRQGGATFLELGNFFQGGGNISFHLRQFSFPLQPLSFAGQAAFAGLGRGTTTARRKGMDGPKTDKGMGIVARLLMQKLINFLDGTPMRTGPINTHNDIANVANGTTRFFVLHVTGKGHFALFGFLQIKGHLGVRSLVVVVVWVVLVVVIAALGSQIQDNGIVIKGIIVVHHVVRVLGHGGMMHGHAPGRMTVGIVMVQVRIHEGIVLAVVVAKRRRRGRCCTAGASGRRRRGGCCGRRIGHVPFDLTNRLGLTDIAPVPS